MKPKVIILIMVVFWLVVGGLVIRTNRLWISPVTFNWPNIRQPNATFSWLVKPNINYITIPANTTRNFRVDFPRKFSTGKIYITTAPGAGSLTIKINAPAGKPNTSVSALAGEKIIMPLKWDAIATQARTFSVDLMSNEHSVEIKNISMTLSHEQ